jgi:hypothetical protein
MSFFNFIRKIYINNFNLTFNPLLYFTKLSLQKQLLYIRTARSVAQRGVKGPALFKHWYSTGYLLGLKQYSLLI